MGRPTRYPENPKKVSSLFSLLVLIYFLSLLWPELATALEGSRNVVLARLSIPTLKMISVSHGPELARTSVKDVVLRVFDGQQMQSNIYACPESLQPVQLITRFYGLFTEKYFLDKKFGAKYPINSQYADFVLKREEFSNYRIGQKFFQIPLVSGLYERGYRQNFERFGFPGIDREYEEAEAFFLGMNATSVVLDLSCGSGFMTRRFIKSNR